MRGTNGVPQLVAVSLWEGHLDMAVRRVHGGDQPVDPVVVVDRFVEEDEDLRPARGQQRQAHST